MDLVAGVVILGIGVVWGVACGVGLVCRIVGVGGAGTRSVVRVLGVGLLGRVEELGGSVLSIDQLVEGDSVEAGEGDEVVGVGAGLGALPFGDCLTGDSELLGQLLLGEAMLAAEGGEALGDGDVHGRAFLCGGLRDEVMRFHWFQRAKKAGCVPPLLG